MVLRFAVAADGHWGLNNSELNWPQMISWLHAEKEDKGLDFVIFNGDNAHNNPLLLYDVKNTLQTLTIPFIIWYAATMTVPVTQNGEAIWGYPKIMILLLAITHLY